MKFLIIPCIALLLAGCRKKDDYVYPVKYYQEYSNSFLTHFSGYRLFTRDGEIHDHSLIALYTRQYASFFYVPGAVFSDPEYKTFSLLNDDSIFNISRAPIAELKRTGYGVYDTYTSNYKVPVNDTNALFLHLGQYRMHEPAITPSGYRYVELQSPAYVLKKIGDTLFFPMMRYVITSLRDYTFSFTSDKLNNVFSPAGAAKLKEYDTLLVQSFDLGLRRKR
jgi:hypothetical protein